MSMALTDSDIAARIRHVKRCPLCHEHRRPGGTLCWEHHDQLGRMLDPDYLGDRDLERAASIPVLFARLDPAPTATNDQDRRAPGFHSTPPLNLHIVALRDNRSTPHPVVDVWYTQLPSGADDLSRPHYETEGEARPVALAMSAIVDAIWDDLGYHGPRTPGGNIAEDGVDGPAGWLHCHLDHLTARDDADDLYRDITELHDQLRPAAGDPKPQPVAVCTGWVRIPETGEKVECKAPLYLPPPQPGVKINPSRPVLRCPRCNRPYTSLMLLRLEIGAEHAQAC